MLNNDLKIIQDWIHYKLIHIYSLTEKLNSLILKDMDDNKSKINELKNHQIPNFKESIYERGYKTPRELKELEKVEPETVKEFNRQFWISIKLIWEESQIAMAENSFLQLNNSSIFLLTIAHFENGLRLLCEYYKKERKITLSWRDLKGSSLDVYKNYFIKVVGLNYNFGKSTKWSEMRESYLIRNFLIHKGGILDDSEQSKKALVIASKNKLLKFNESYELIISKDYLNNVIEVADNFYLDFFNNAK